MIFLTFLLQTAIAMSFAKPFDRERSPGRAMTWSGWMPGSGMGIFASSEDPWGQDGRSSMFGGSGWYQEPEAPKLKPFDEDDKGKKPDEKTSKPLRPTKHKKYDDDEEDGRRYSGSNANASFNAWFPIMLGYPEESRSRGYPEDSRSRGSGYRSREREDGSVAAIANSVNHGRSGVASSHAVVYSGQQPSYNKNARF